MKIKNQIISKFQALERRNRQLSSQLQKYQQEIEYVCLKTGVKDWMSFLVEIRLGKIVSADKEKGEGYQIQIKEGKSSAIRLLNELFEGISTDRSTARPNYCDCESPVCSEGNIHHAKGGDTSRSQSSQYSQLQIQKQRELDEKEIRNKFQEIGKGQVKKQQESIEQILKYIQAYQVGKEHPMQGFDTFRKKSDRIDETRQYTYKKQALHIDEPLSSTQRVKGIHMQQTTKKQPSYNNLWRGNDTPVNQMQQCQPVSHIKSDSEYILAIQNTRLRQIVRQLEGRLLNQEKYSV